MDRNDDAKANKDEKSKKKNQQVRQEKAQEVKTEDVGRLVTKICSIGGDGLPTATVSVRGVKMGMKLDTCASYSVASPDKKRYGERLRVVAPVTHVEGLGGQELRVHGVWRFKLRTEYEQLITLDALVVEGCKDELIMGLDFIENKGVEISFSTKEAVFYEGEKQVIVPFTCKTGVAGQAVRLIRGKKVATQAITMVRVPVTAEEGTVGVLHPSPTGTAWVLAAPTVTRVQGGHVCVPVLNVLGKKTRLPPRKRLGMWIPVDADMELIDLDGGLDKERVEAWVTTLSSSQTTPLANEKEAKLEHLEHEKRELMLRLLRSFPRVSTEDKVCPPPTTTGVRHYIPAGTAAPIRLRRFRNSERENAVISEQIKEMLQHGVIEMANGPWGFPVVLVKKKDGSVRFCIDYRALNAVTVKDVYPLPRIDETVEALGGAKWFTTFDLMAGYWQVKVAKEDRDKTAFLTREGLYRFVRMPFGLSNAPSTFQRLMDCVLRGLLWVCCLVYLDDIVVFTRGAFERHIVELAVVLARLEDAGLTIKLRKCQFATSSIEYLGHQLSEEGVQPTERLIKAIADCPAPTDEKGVKRFVHLAGYYRRFVEGFGSKLEPLTRLLKKRTPWEWGVAQQVAFENVKRELSTKPLLVYPDFGKPFVLATDASTIGLGAVLMQDQGKGLQPIGYASKVNNECQAKYPITQLECLAVVWAVQYFRPYLYGREFKVITDHHALKWLMSKKDLTGKLHRWALALQEYNFKLEFRPGKENVVPDALSRAPVLHTVANNEDDHLEERALEGTVQVDEATVVGHQSDSKMCRDALRAGSLRGQRVEKRNGVVSVYTQDGGWRVLLPATLWAAVLKECHDSVWSGHLKTVQTLARVARNFWWPSMRKIVTAWTASCRDCGSRKARPRKVIPPLRSLRVGAVGDRWALDVAGPLPLTHTGNRYVVAMVEYVTKYVVAVPVANHTAAVIATMIVDEIVFKHGPFRELVMDGAPELQSALVTALVTILQAKQATPVPYRPNLLGLVERFNRTWKDMVAIYVSRHQNDWDEWVKAAAYAYNSAQNTVTGCAPFYLMTGREPRAPRDLLLSNRVEVIENVGEWHRKLRTAVADAMEVATTAIGKEQRRQARYYNRQARRGAHFYPQQLVWVHRPPQGKKKTKLKHRWIGPCRVEEATGYDNFRVTRMDDKSALLVHESLMLAYTENVSIMESVAADLQDELLEDEDERTVAEIRTGVRTRAQAARSTAGGTGVSTVRDGEESAQNERTTARVLATRREEQRDAENVRGFLQLTPAGTFFVERRRRIVRNTIGRYEPELEVAILTGPDAGRTRWMTLEEFEMLWVAGKDVADDVQLRPGE